MSAATLSCSGSAVPPPAVLRLLLGRSLADWRSWLLCASAYALVGGLLISVVAGVTMYWSHDYAEPGMRMLYRTLSAVALCILGLPLVQPAGAAAKLSARRRDARLSGLRLLGAGRAMLHALVLLQALLQAAIGLLAGLGIYAALIPALGGLHVDGVRIGAAALVLPWWAIALCVAALLGTAGPAAAAGLRRVSITPLAVRTRRDVPAMGKWRLILPVLMVLAALLGGRAVLIDQAAAADDRWQAWFGLHRLGMPVAQIDRARRLAVMRPLWVLLVIAVGATVIVLSPMIGVGALISPMTLAAVVVVLGAGAAMIPIALRATRPALRRRAEGGPAGL